MDKQCKWVVQAYTESNLHTDPGELENDWQYAWQIQAFKKDLVDIEALVTTDISNSALHALSPDD